jgi:hypothetical protein
MRIRLFVAMVSLSILAAQTFSEPLRLGSEFPRRTYVLGDKVIFKVSFENTTQDTLLILPAMQAYAAQVLRCQRIPDGTSANVIRFGERSIDFQALSKQTVRLAPKQVYKWSLTADFASSLPAFMKRKARGAYLVFPGFALELPGFGSYRVTTRYSSNEENPVNNFLHGAKLWVGEAESAPVTLEFRRR